MRTAIAIVALAAALTASRPAEACDTCGGKGPKPAPDKAACAGAPAGGGHCPCCGCAKGETPEAAPPASPEGGGCLDLPPGEGTAEKPPASEPPEAPHEGHAGAICAKGQTIVLLRPDADPDEAAALFERRYQGTVCRVYRHSIRGVTLRCTGPAVVQALSHDPLVISTEPDVTVRALGGSQFGLGASAEAPPSLASGPQEVPTGLRRMGWERAARGAAAKAALGAVGVAVLDTGIDAGHPDLEVTSFVNIVEGSENGDGSGHGTHCAGTIAAKDDEKGVVGVAPGVRLYAIKVLDDDGSGTLSDVIAGLDWVSKHAKDVAVVNLSLGVTGKSPSLRAAIQSAVAAGVVVVAAAGNDMADIFGEDGVAGTEDDRIPAAFPEVCAVSALADSDGRPGGDGPETRAGKDDSIALFSCHSSRPHEGGLVRSSGGAIDVAAPGVDILSTWPGGGYRRISGTSMAAPHVAGLAARLVASMGRDANGDGRIDARDVYAIRQALVETSEGQSRWRADGATGDTDARHEGLARIPGGPLPDPAELVRRPVPAPAAPARPTPPPSAGEIARAGPSRPAAAPPAYSAPRPLPSSPSVPFPRPPSFAPAPSPEPTSAPRRERRPTRALPEVVLGDADDAPPVPAALAVPGVEVVAIVPGSDQGEGARESVLVGIRNHGARETTAFDVVLTDLASGKGIGRFRVSSIGASAHRTVVFPFDRDEVPVTARLRAVVLRK